MTLAPTRLEEQRTALALHPNVESAETELTAGTVRIRARSATRSWSLRLKVEPMSGWPEFSLVDEPLVGRLAHVNHSGIVCVTDKVGLSLDPVRAGEVASAALTSALEQLERSLAAERANEFGDLFDEFEGYWLSVPGIRNVDVHFVADLRLRQVTAVLNSEWRCLAFTERRINKSDPYLGVRRYQSQPHVPALYVPLSSPVLPPSPSRPLTVEMVREWASKNLAPTDRPELEKHLKSWPKTSNACLLFSQPRPLGARAAFGVQFNATRSTKHPLIAQSVGWSTRPLLAVRHAAQDLRPRGGANETLATRRVAVIGCGAVGSRVAEHLALAGVNALTLVDPDRFDAENLYRHVLGGEACGANKAAALKTSLERRLPDLRVEAEELRIDQWLTPERIAGVDGIVLAIGVPHLERAFVRQARQLAELRAPIVTTWLEPLGLGGHAQCTKPKVAGCLECLYTSTDGTSGQIPKTIFVEPGQALSRNLTGCVGSFVPFSALDATQTALLAARMLTAALTDAPHPSYIAWRGSDRECAAAGIRTTRWYEELDDAAIGKAAVEYSKVRCPVCGGTT